MCSQSRWFCSIPFPSRLDVDGQASTTSEGEPPINDDIQLIKTFAEYGSATDFKGFEALHATVLDLDDHLLCSDVQTEVGHTYNELQRSLRDVSAKRSQADIECQALKKIMHSQQITLA